MELKYVGSVIRTGMAVVAGYLVAHGVSDETANTFISSSGDVIAGVVTYALTQVWSIAQKAKHSD